MTSKINLPLLVLISASLILLLIALQFFQILVVPPHIFTPLRWAVLLLFIFYAAQKRSLTTWIFVGMLAGIEMGHDFPKFSADNLGVLSQVFLRLIKSIIAPLLFGTLVVGIAGHSNLKQVGRMGWKSIVYFEAATTIALIIGLIAINFTEAGKGIDLSSIQGLGSLPTVKDKTWQDHILDIFPENIAKSIAEGHVLQVVIFSILFGIGLAKVNDKLQKPVLNFAESLSEAMFKFTELIMYFTPFAVAGAIAYTVGQMGIEVLKNLFMLVLTLYGALVVFVLVVFVPVALIIKLPIKRFINAISEPVSIAFATANSESALPKAMSAMESLGVPRKIVSFVMPMGYSFNLDGTTLYLALATVFVAQAADIDLSIGKQLLIVFTLMLTSKGVAGVSKASLVILLATASQFNLPEAPIAAVFAVDQLMDMARTSVNVVGNCLATAVVAKWEGEFNPSQVIQEPVAV